MNEALEILLVEDDPNDLEIALHALQKNNFGNAIEIARDGAEALEMLHAENRDYRPRLVLLDLKLPKVDGIEVLEKLKAHPRTRSIPVVVLTSSREERDLVESYGLGVNSYIVKPVSFERFTEAVRLLGMYWLLLNEVPVEPIPQPAEAT